MSTYRRKAQPTIEAIRLPRPMQLLDGHDRRGKPVFIQADAGDYLVVEGEQYYVLTAQEFAAQFEADEHAVIQHRKPQHVQGETTITPQPFWQVFPDTWRNPLLPPYTVTNQTATHTSTKCYVDLPEAPKAV